MSSLPIFAPGKTAPDVLGCALSSNWLADGSTFIIMSSPLKAQESSPLFHFFQQPFLSLQFAHMIGRVGVLEERTHGRPCLSNCNWQQQRATPNCKSGSGPELSTRSLHTLAVNSKPMSKSVTNLVKRSDNTLIIIRRFRSGRRDLNLPVRVRPSVRPVCQPLPSCDCLSRSLPLPPAHIFTQNSPPAPALHLWQVTTFCAHRRPPRRSRRGKTRVWPLPPLPLPACTSVCIGRTCSADDVGRPDSGPELRAISRKSTQPM